MEVKELESRMDALEQEVKRLRILEKEVQKFKDIEEINRLQRAYGYYLEHVMYNELADLWCDGPEAELQWVGSGTFKGKETIRKVWSLLHGKGNPELLHMAIQISGIVTVNPDGETARGRWYCLGTGFLPIGKRNRVSNLVGTGLYENDYVKENGTWKIKVMQYGGIISWKADGAMPPDKVAAPEDFAMDNHGDEYPYTIKYEEPTPIQEYPSGYIRPFHFKHPVTGKASSEGAWNAALPPMKRPKMI
jgi:hypothetical protein